MNNNIDKLLSQTLSGRRPVRPWRRLSLICLIPIILLLTQNSHNDWLSRIQQQKALNVGLVFNPVTYYQQGQGLEYRLLEAFAEQLDIPLNIQLFNSEEALSKAIANHRIDIGAAEFDRNINKVDGFLQNTAYSDFSLPYLQSESIIIQHRDQARVIDIDNIEDIVVKKLKVTVIQNSSQAVLFRKLQQQFPELLVDYTDSSVFQLMQDVQQQKVALAAISQYRFMLKRNYFPHISKVLSMEDDIAIAWSLPNSKDQSLLSAVNQFLQDYKDNGHLQDLTDDYFRLSEEFDFISSLTFKNKLNRQFPVYEPLFKEVAKEFDMDWLLLAAMAYQESHWDANAPFLHQCSRLNDVNSSHGRTNGRWELARPRAKFTWRR